MSKQPKKRKQQAASKREVRVRSSQQFEVRTNAEDGSRSVVGYAALFNSLSEDLGGFKEKISPGAFQESLRTNPDVLMLYGHDMNNMIARGANGSLQIAEDNRGLKFSAKIPDTQLGRDLITLLEDGLISKMSFGFSVSDGGDTWQEINGQIIRVLTQVNLYEISAVSLPAYSDTVCDVRSAPATLRAKLKRKRKSDADDDLDDIWDEDEDDEDNDYDDDEDRCLALRSAEQCRCGMRDCMSLGSDGAERKAHLSLLLKRLR